MTNPIISSKIGPRLLRVTVITLVVYIIYINFIRDTKENYSLSFILTDVPQSENIRVGIQGSESPLSWEESIYLRSIEDYYVAEIEFPISVHNVEFLFVAESSGGEEVLESIPRRQMDVKSQNGKTISFKWNVE